MTQPGTSGSVKGVPRYKAMLHADVVVVLGQEELVNAGVQDLRQAGTCSPSPKLSEVPGGQPQHPNLRKGVEIYALRKHGKPTWCDLTISNLKH